MEGEGTHRIDELLHFLPGEASVDRDSNRIYFLRNAAQLAVFIFADEPLDISIAEGRESPFRGWFAPRLGVLEPAPSVRITGNADLPVVRHMLLVPYRLGEPLPVLSARIEENRIVCETAGGMLEVPVEFWEPEENEGDDTPSTPPMPRQ